MTGADKLNSYTTEASERSIERWEGKEKSTNSYIFLDLQEFCQFGCKIVRFLKEDGSAWTPYGVNQVLQKHVTVTLDKCLAYSHSGIGLTKKDGGSGRLQAGVGITLNAVVQQVNGNAKQISVCHYDANGTEVRGKFNMDYFKRDNAQKGAEIAGTIVN
ncbi:MAG: hypothetical protein B7Z58_10195 [Acidiphilium sp. 37-64-53]|nr:MAG: hypothetical protein B7Z58_10195 [Acidiphilium sp. 37-64-53]